MRRTSQAGASGGAAPSASSALRIHHLATRAGRGGAARATRALHRGLRAAGVESRLWVAERWCDDPGIALLPEPDDAPARARAARIARDRAVFAATRPAGLEPFSDDRSPFGAAPLAALAQADLVHLHWVGGLLDHGELLPGLAARRPIVWTLHDMNGFTGGCHYDRGCGRWSRGCGRCPQLGSRDASDLSRRVFERKARALAAIASDRLHVVCLSRWLEDQVARSPLLSRFDRSLIPGGADPEFFTPFDRAAARRELGYGPDDRVVLFVAASLASERKGAARLVRALDRLRDVPGLRLLTAGKDALPAPSPVPHLALGLVDDRTRLARAYATADVVAVPSLQDVSPHTALEGLASGRPVVATAAGGLCDLVDDERTGLLASPDDAAYARALGRVLRDDALRDRLGRQAFRVAAQEFSPERSVGRTLDLYRKILGR
ncbi:MAG TPA: glycosyltransferase [Myxococcota bacterium]|nr:glycosyltransferase [Myxococcota bacterium]